MDITLELWRGDTVRRDTVTLCPLQASREPDSYGTQATVVVYLARGLPRRKHTTPMDLLSCLSDNNIINPYPVKVENRVSS